MKLTTQELANFIYFKGNALKNFRRVKKEGGEEEFEGKMHKIPPQNQWNYTATIMALLYVKGAHPDSGKGMKQKEIEEAIADNGLLDL